MRRLPIHFKFKTELRFLFPPGSSFAALRWNAIFASMGGAERKSLSSRQGESSGLPVAQPTYPHRRGFVSHCRMGERAVETPKEKRMNSVLVESTRFFVRGQFHN